RHGTAFRRQPPREAGHHGGAGRHSHVRGPSAPREGHRPRRSHGPGHPAAHLRNRRRVDRQALTPFAVFVPRGCRALADATKPTTKKKASGKPEAFFIRVRAGARGFRYRSTRTDLVCSASERVFLPPASSTTGLLSRVVRRTSMRSNSSRVKRNTRPPASGNLARVLRA